jgi:methylated-DNA-[protein]-cysteine S-methyltransferase
MEPPEAVSEVIVAVTALLSGAPEDLAFVAIDMNGIPDFNRRVYEVARTIRPGSTLTYGEVARRIGEPWAAQAVGQALGRNPFAIIVPCHRVVAAGDRLGGFSADGGRITKQRLLEIEGALPANLFG